MIPVSCSSSCLFLCCFVLCLFVVFCFPVTDRVASGAKRRRLDVNMWESRVKQSSLTRYCFSLIRFVNLRSALVFGVRG